MAAVAFETLAGWLLQRAEELLPQWLPAGKWIGPEWCLGDLHNERGQSLRINRQSGLWSDFATGQKGRDLIALWAAMRDLQQLDSAKELAEKYGYGEIESKVMPLRPVLSAPIEPEAFEWPPGDAITPAAFRHPKHGEPTQVYPYLSLDRRLIYVMARYETEAGKQFCPWTWRAGRWRSKGLPPPRPLYGLERLEAHGGTTILVEGEKAADALQGATQRASVLTWSGGANNWKHADWSVLRGRSCILWPDADTAGFAAMQGIAGLLLELECPLQMIDTEGLPEAFDAADLIAQAPTHAALNQWIRARLHHVERPQPAVQEVLAPCTIVPAVTVLESGEKDPERPARPRKEAASDEPPSYALATQYGLSFNKQGVHANLANARSLVEGLVLEGGLPPLHYDEFLQRVMTQNREWEEYDTLKLTNQMQRRFGITNVRKHIVEDAISLYAYDYRRNSAQEWLKSLAWDGHKRLEKLFTTGFGTQSNDYTKSVGRCFMIGLAARILHPGCQVDHLPVLEGEQGIRKSSALRVLGGDYHVECQESVMGKDFYLVLSGKALVEISELQSFRRADAERTKAIITCTTDRYRAPYERRASDHPRQCVFIATTNRDDWNCDDSGARRFWPIACGRIDIEWIKEYRLQLFAEGIARFQRGESWWDVPVEDARIEQEKRRAEDNIGHPLRYYCRGRTRIVIAEVMESMGLQGVQRYDRSMQQRIASTLRSWGYRSTFSKDEDGTTVRTWHPPPSRKIDEEEDPA